MNDVFISYARFDLAWVEDELMQALKETGATFFLDDAEWRKRREDVDANGLQPGQNMEDALAAALHASRVILLVQSPGYFSSKWCRWELELAEKLAAESAKAGGELKLIYFILSRHEGRLDPTAAGERVLYVDLTNVRERADKLAYALERVSAKAKGLQLSLGRRSLQDLLAEPAVEAQVHALRDRHATFRDAHAKMQAYKEAHDAIQRAQDAWHALAAARDDLTAGKPVFTLKMAGDLSEKCSYIRSCIATPVLAAERFAWRGQLDRSIAAAAELLKNAKNLEVLNKTLESTRGFLFLSIAPAELNNRIRDASSSLPIASLREALAPLKALRQYRWQAAPLEKLTELAKAFDELEALLAEIADLVAVHDVLQNIDSVFSTALHVEAKLADIENIWPDIEAERQKFDARILATRESLQQLGIAAEAMNEYLKQVSKPDAPPKDEIGYFKSTLNQSFVRADTDLRQDTLLLEKQHETIDTLLDRLAGLAPPSQP